MKKYLTLTPLILLLTSFAFSQDEEEIATTSIVRVNFINPAIEAEWVTGKKTIFTTALGVGYGGGYPQLTTAQNGVTYIISPFLEIQHKWFTNLEKRHQRNKITQNNSGNFWSLRLLSRGKSWAENVERSTATDFAIGPTWGLQRNFAENFNFLFDVGPVYYFDTEGTGGFFPIILQFNLGYNLK